MFDERDEMMVYFGDADAICAVHGKTILVLTETEWAGRYYDGQVPSMTANSTRPAADKINRVNLPGEEP